MPVRIDARLLQAHGTADLRGDAVRILEYALNAVDAYTVTARAVRLTGDTLLVDGNAFPSRGVQVSGAVLDLLSDKACRPNSESEQIQDEEMFAKADRFA